MAAGAGGLLREAKELFQQGQAEQAEAIVTRLLRENPHDATALNFRAYLLYKRGRVDDAMAAYRRLAELEPHSGAHLANLGLLCFKAGRYLEARTAFERLLERQPGDAKTLRNLGFCHERRQELEEAIDCFQRAGDEESVARVRERLAKPVTAEREGRWPEAGPGPSAGPAAGRGPQAPDVSGWLERTSLPRPGEGPEVVAAGRHGLAVQVREKVYVNPAFCSAHRGVVVFAPSLRDAERAASKFGDRGGLLARAEGNGELLLSGGDRELVALELGGARLFVNHAALVLVGTEVDVSFDLSRVVKEAFLAVELNGFGPLVLAARGGPVVVPVPSDLPTLVRPAAVVAWTEHLACETETVPELKKLLGKEAAQRLRFDGRGYLILQAV